MKRVILGLIVVASTLGISLPAHADTAGCVTHQEYKRVHNGMTVRQVRNIYDTPGTLAVSSSYLMIRDYRTCTPYHVTNVSFSHKRVNGKTYI